MKRYPAKIYSDQADYLVVLVAASSVFYVNIIGNLYVSEMIMVAVALWIFFTKRAVKLPPYQGGVSIAIFLWLLSQVTTDFIRGTSYEDLARGWARIIFFGLAMFLIPLLVADTKRVVLWLCGMSAALILRPFIVFGEGLDLETAWKFGVGQGALFAVSSVLWIRLVNGGGVRPNLKYFCTLLLLFALASLALNARSFAATCLVNALVGYLYIRYSGIRMRATHMLVALGMVAGLASVLGNIYSYSASSGLLGVSAKEKYDLQYVGGEGLVELLLGGRSEMLVSTVAISDSPILGHGSWAKNIEYTILLKDLRRERLQLDDDRPIDESTKTLIPSHSYLLGSWVDAGIMGAAFWFFIVWIALFRAIPAAFERSDVIGFFSVFIAPTLVWNILFSPFGASVRVEAAGYIAIVLLALIAPVDTRYRIKGRSE